MLNEDVIEFLQSMGGGMLCTRNADCQPAASELLFAEVTSDHIVGFVPAHLGPHLPTYLADSTVASCVTSRTYGDHRSVQLKGRISAFEDARVHDRAEFGEVPFNMANYYPQLPSEQVHQLLAHVMERPAFRVELDVTELFDQTPGPRAGAPLGGEK